MEKLPIEAVGYTRGWPGQSELTQMAKIEAAARRNGQTIVEWYNEQNSDRIQMNRLIADASHQRMKVVIICEPTDLSSSQPEVDGFIAAMKENGVTLQFLGGGTPEQWREAAEKKMRDPGSIGSIMLPHQIRDANRRRE